MPEGTQRNIKAGSDGPRGAARRCNRTICEQMQLKPRRPRRRRRSRRNPQ